MTTILTSGEAEILIELEKEGMGICFSGPLPPNPDPEFQEAYDLLEGLIEYFEGEKNIDIYEKLFIVDGKILYTEDTHNYLKALRKWKVSMGNNTSVVDRLLNMWPSK